MKATRPAPIRLPFIPSSIRNDGWWLADPREPASAPRSCAFRRGRGCGEVRALVGERRR